MAVTDAHDLFTRKLYVLLAIIHEHKIVPGAVHLGELQNHGRKNLARGLPADKLQSAAKPKPKLSELRGLNRPIRESGRGRNVLAGDGLRYRSGRTARCRRRDWSRGSTRWRGWWRLR